MQCPLCKQAMYVGNVQLTLFSPTTIDVTFHCVDDDCFQDPCVRRIHIDDLDSLPKVTES